MDFTFSDDQLAFQDSVRSFLTNEVTPEVIRELWQRDGGRSDELWTRLAGMGLTALTVPEGFGGLGLDELDFVLLAQECGYAALPEPLVETVMVAVPLLAALDDSHYQLQEHWLSRVASGEARLAVGHPCNPLVADAHVADLLLLCHGDEIHAVPATRATLSAGESVDPSRRLFRVDWTPSPETLVASGETGRRLQADTLNRGALACAAQQLGLANRMVDIAVDYSFERKQFGSAVGAFQAVKHHMANVAVKAEFTRAVLYCAAYDVARGLSSATVAVSHAKIAATEAALLAAKNGIQVHGAMGYTWEVDLHIFMKRAWALDNAWGSRGVHKARVGDFVFADGAPLGTGATFG
ncbi:acyl-CoA dehydrogenase family protein [Marinobacterium aestuariivivens]|uniref:Acyl-CoA dehydrogenase family protein n=1 Tax=Marinobacterium aestuariivivens TaxID=1698799 RepID=A0ABW2A3W9_9GAMM